MTAKNIRLGVIEKSKIFKHICFEKHTLNLEEAKTKHGQITFINEY